MKTDPAIRSLKTVRLIKRDGGQHIVTFIPDDKDFDPAKTPTDNLVFSLNKLLQANPSLITKSGYYYFVHGSVVDGKLVWRRRRSSFFIDVDNNPIEST